MSLAAPAFDVVMLGGDIGVYSLARAFHEAFGVRSTVIRGSRPARSTRRSSTTCCSVPRPATRTTSRAAAPGPERTAAEAALGREATPVILLANTDGYSRLFAAHWAGFDAFYRISLVDVATLDQISDKGRFAEACTEIGVPTPITHTRTFSLGSRPVRRR